MKTRPDRPGGRAGDPTSTSALPDRRATRPGADYRIRVRGMLDDSWSVWFDGLSITHTADGDTTLAGTLPDQAALHGLLARVRDLGLTLLAVEQPASAGVDAGVPPETGRAPGGDPGGASWDEARDLTLARPPGRPASPAAASSRRLPVLLGLAFGAIQVASPIALWWLSAATVQALLLAAIAATYVGFAVADGRPRVIVAEAAVATAFVLIAAVSLEGSAWLLVAGYVGHGLKDAWQERHRFVANTRWWPPFCAAVDWLVATALIVAIVAGADLHS